MFVKPDGVSRGLVGEVVHRVERKGLKSRPGLAALGVRPGGLPGDHRQPRARPPALGGGPGWASLPALPHGAGRR